MAYGAAPIEISSGDPWTPLSEAIQGSGLDVSFDPQGRVLTMSLTHEHRYTFNLGLLCAMRTVLDCAAQSRGQAAPLTLLITSAHADVFSFGGDLEAFDRVLSENDEARLTAYATACIDVVHRVHRLCRHGILSVASVSGDALGGGFELALAADYLVVRPDARLCLPERNFGSFPGMGAYSFLRRRIGRRHTERLILSGEPICGEEAVRIGAADALMAEDGAADFLRATRQRPGTYLSVARARNEVPREELDRIVGDWAHGLASSDRRDRRRIAMLAQRQRARRAREVRVLPGGSAALPPNPFRQEGRQEG